MLFGDFVVQVIFGHFMVLLQGFPRVSRKIEG